MTSYAASAARFQREAPNPQMEVKLDQGIYRHLRFTSDESSLYWWDLITWPYNLIVNGSHGSYHFCRFGPDTEDMFHLFRGSLSDRSINPGYWAEKVRAGEIRSWSETKFRTWVAGEAAALEPRYPGITAAVIDEVLRSDEHNLEYEECARVALGSFSFGHARIRFPDAWELKFDEYHWQYLWQCHAIVAGIRQYDAAQPKQAVS
ncbi:hypothetical protein ACIQKB_03905 [Streptomyces sp. NPDC092046]|uniref:hypothetical protein n=1 Tax=Streptomyces sp. NPDC092046 TaxID=3366009 RepID=UPI00381F712B